MKTVVEKDPEVRDEFEEKEDSFQDGQRFCPEEKKKDSFEEDHKKRDCEGKRERWKLRLGLLFLSLSSSGNFFKLEGGVGM